jgi:hypothetical protein
VKKHIPEVGNVYQAKGGHGRGTPDMWVIVSVVGGTVSDLLGKKVVLLGIKYDMSIVSSATYNAMSFCKRELLFQIDITELRFET